MTHTHVFLWNTNHVFLNQVLVLFILLFSNTMFAQNDTKDAVSKTKAANESLINQYIQSKGSNIITFDSSNIKQFWIDKSVISKDGSFEILLNGLESVPLKIQLANVNEAQDCKIEVISTEKDFVFSVLNSNLRIISTSSSEEDFLHYTIKSSIIHLENASNFSFCLKFSSKNDEKISIEKIVLSFSNNKASSFLASPGVLKITGNDVDGGENKKINENDGSFSVSGKRFGIFSKKKIIVSDNTFSNHITIKNIGSQPTQVYLGYVPCTKDGQNIHNRNNPYKNINKVLTVVSSEINSNEIVVDSYPEWEKGCFLVLNAKEDMSDFPNFSFIDGSISEIKKLDDTHSVIIFDKPIKTQIKPGTKVRVHSKHGATYLYVKSARLNPGREITFSSEIKKDESYWQYGRDAFSKGTYYVIPVVLSYSIDENEVNTIMITDFTVSY